MKENKPLVSIGMPVYNGDRYLRQAIDSLLAQDYPHFELIISDNASTDKTSVICQEYAAKDSRIRYYTNPTNIGAPKNFKQVFDLAKGNFFMWAAHDDLWEPSYIQKCLNYLERSPSAVLCCSEITFINEDGSVKTDWTSKFKNINTLGMDIPGRIHQLIAWVGWFAIYGVIRSEALKNVDLVTERYAGDVTILLELMLQGDLVKVPERLFRYRIPEQRKTTDDYLNDLDPVEAKKVKQNRVDKSYSYIARELLNIVFKANLDSQVKSQIYEDFVETLSTHFDWVPRLLQEQGIDRSQIPVQQMRQLVKTAIAPENYPPNPLNKESEYSSANSAFEIGYQQIQQPKKRGGVSYAPGAEDRIVARLRHLGVQVEEYEIDVAEYRQYFQTAGYLQQFDRYYAFNRIEKSLEHYVAAKLLKLSDRDIYIDIGSEHSPVPEIYRRLFGLQAYRQDLAYPPGVNGDRIGGSAANMPIPNETATKMALHCAFEHFEGTADMGFVRETTRVLKPGGAACILPLYLSEEYAIQTDPVTALSTGGVDFEEDAVIYCAEGWHNRHGRFYDPEHLVQRICQNLNGINLKIYRIKNAVEVDPSCYLRFAAILEKPAVNSPLELSPTSTERSDRTPTEKTRGRKALIFFPHNPYPPQTGAHKRCLEIVDALKFLGYEITLFSSTLFSDHPWNVNSIRDLQEQFGIQVKIHQGSDRDRQYMAQISARKSGGFNWDYYTPPGLRESFDRLFQAIAPEIIIVNYSLWGKLASGKAYSSAVRIIDTIDLFTLNLKMRQALQPYLLNPPLTPERINPQALTENFYAARQLDASPEEYAIFDEYDYCISISSVEAEKMQKHTHRTRVECVPMSFEIEPSQNTYTGSAILAIGDNPFNVQGCLYFAAKVLPLIQQQIPEFTLKVVGTGCKHLAPVPGIEVLGFVPDLKPLYAESRFAICPLIGGTGQQIKIVEAMAHGVPAIALQNVAASSPIEDNINGFIVANAREFADRAIELWQNPQRCRQLGEAARQTIELKFSKSVLANRMKQITARIPLDSSNFQPKVIVDGVFYQINNTGIARVWYSLLQEWVNTGFAKHILFLDRVGTAPRIPGIKYLCIPAYDYQKTDSDRIMLQQICDEENADIFISTYYTTPLSTPSVFMGYDMIPELSRANLADAMWREKHYGIRHASAYVTISENTARDLLRVFPHINPDTVNVAHCGISSTFSPGNPQEIARFNAKYGISKPYFLLVGLRVNINQYKNAILFFQAFAQLPNRHNFEIVCVGGQPQLEPELQVYVPDTNVRILQLNDEELRLAYSGAVALVYPSKYEGFGLPILEAIACGCPAIACPNGAIPEVAGQAAIYVKDDDVPGLVNALLAVQQPQVRHQLITEGFERVKQFSWAKMADRIRSVLIDTARQPAKKAIATSSTSSVSSVEPPPQTPAPAIANPRQIRQQVAQQWLSLPLEQLETAYLGELGKIHQKLLENGIKNEAITESDRAFIDQLSANLARGFQHPQATQTLLAATLYCYPYQLPIQYENAPIPKWFATDYLKFMFAAPTLFHENGDSDRYYRYLQGWLGYVHGKIFSNPDSPVWRSVAEFFTQTPYFRCPYFNSADLKDINEKRSQIIEFALKNRGCQLDREFPPRGSDRKKIRLGILKNHFNPVTETFATLPVFEHLDRQRFEVILYATKSDRNPLETYCQSCSDRFIKLPETLPAQVQTIRADDLDILFIGTNVTAENNAFAALALHRLARVQVTSIASPVTTGFSNIDCYIAGNLTAPTALNSAQYRERLVNVEGSGICFRFPLTEPPATVHPTRTSWGATDETVAFISGANFYKIIPELAETWVKILAAVPNSILVLYPFGPAWSNTYPAMPFLQQLQSICDRYGIQRQRLVLINTLPSPADIKECVKLADIYLDSYPYSGATSLLDPLQLGIPAIAWEGNTLRARQGAALLRELQLPDLIANSETAYIELATKLATNPQLRQQYRQQIWQKMQNNPPFLDSRAYAEKLGNLFQNLLGDRANQEQSNAPGLTPQFLNRLIGCANLYYIDPSDESVLEELRQVRREFAEFWLTVDRDRLENLYASDMGKAHQSVIKSGIYNEPLNDRDRGFVEELTAKLATGIDAPNALNAAIALLLYCDRLPLQSDRLPQWIHLQTVASPGLLG